MEKIRKMLVLIFTNHRWAFLDLHLNILFWIHLSCMQYGQVILKYELKERTRGKYRLY